jgi:hypothetical protein
LNKIFALLAVSAMSLVLGAALVVPTAAPASPSTHWCRAGDPPIEAAAHTSCSLAGYAIDVYANYHYGQRDVGNESIWSPGTGWVHHVRYVRTGGGRYGGGMVTVTGPNVWARFSGDI